MAATLFHQYIKNIHVTKTKDMLASLSREAPDSITVDGLSIEHVTECKLLGVKLNNSLSWHTHVDKMYKPAASCLLFVA